MNAKEPLTQKQKVIKNKVIYLVCTSAMLGMLVFVYYFFFYRTMEIKLSDYIGVSFEGESGFATAHVSDTYHSYNQRIQPFFDSITYSIEPSENLKNGDQIKVSVQYDEKLAENFHIHPTDTSRTFEVTGLAERYKTAQSIPKEFLTEIQQKSDAYLNKDRDRIEAEDFSMLDTQKSIEITKTKALHTVFLKSERMDDKDKIIRIYQIDAKGFHKEQNKEAEEMIYYYVVCEGINSSQKLANENLYGEKITYDEDVSKVEKTLEFLRSKYLLNYDLQIIDEKSTSNYEVTP